MKAITTTFHGPTNTRGARISATDGDNRVSVPYDYSGNDTAHDSAAIKLCQKLGWAGRLASGRTKRGKVYVWLGADDISVLTVGGPAELLEQMLTRARAKGLRPATQSEINLLNPDHVFKSHLGGPCFVRIADHGEEP